jgi:hypothetical protein
MHWEMKRGPGRIKGEKRLRHSVDGELMRFDVQELYPDSHDVRIDAKSPFALDRSGARAQKTG